MDTKLILLLVNGSFIVPMELHQEFGAIQRDPSFTQPLRNAPHLQRIDILWLQPSTT
jgi:hypothetical protein